VCRQVALKIYKTKGRIKMVYGIYGDSYTLQEIANMLGVTRERARQIEMQALKKLKHPRFRKQWNEIMETSHMLSNGRENMILGEESS
jgi:transcriptional regulator